MKCLDTKVDSIFIKVLNGRTPSDSQQEGEVWLEYIVYLNCLRDDDPKSCDTSVTLPRHVLYLKPGGLSSDLIDISTLIQPTGVTYILEIRNLSGLTAVFESIEYLFIFCQAQYAYNPDTGRQELRCVG